MNDLAVIEPRRDSLGNYEQPLQPGPPTDLGWMLSCSGVHPEAVKIVEAYQAELERLRELLREAEADPYANMTVSLSERIRAALQGGSPSRFQGDDIDRE